MTGSRHEADRIQADAGGARIVYLVAVAEGPVTAAELADMVDVTRGTVNYHLLRLWRSGFLVRRERPRGSRGNPYYEYALAPLEKMEQQSNMESEQ